MTGIRQSIVFSREKEGEYGQGKDPAAMWLAPPPGTFFTSTHNRNVQRIQTTGSKFWDAQAYGQLGGSWSWTFTMDYNYLEPFYFLFESIDSNSGLTSPAASGIDAGMGVSMSDTTGIIHTFQKINNDRVKSFTVLRKINNQMVGGSRNEITQLTGCVVKSFQFQRSAATSKIDVSLSGFYSNERLLAEDADLTSIWPTDYQEYDDSDGGLIEYSCLYAGGLGDGEYMANTESISIGVDNSAAAVYSVCSPFASNYYEGLTNISFSTTCYSTDPLQYKTRLYSGGFTNRPPQVDGAYVPMSKGMKPVPKMCIGCYSNQINRDDPTYEPDPGTAGQDSLPSNNNQANTAYTRTVAEAFADSVFALGFQLDQVVIKSLPWQKGDGSKLQDSISSSEAQKLIMYVKTKGPKHKTSGDPLSVDDWFTANNKHALSPQPETLMAPPSS